MMLCIGLTLCVGGSAGKGLHEGKTPGAGKAARRVLGDVTNMTPGLQLNSTCAEPPAKQHQAAAPAQARAELYAADGVEHRAGKGWQQLEAERLQRESAAAQQRARDAILPWVTRRLPPQVGYWCTFDDTCRFASSLLPAACCATMRTRCTSEWLQICVGGTVQDLC
jgi:hypothetical protein